MTRYWHYLLDPDGGRHLLEGLFPILLGLLVAIGGTSLGVYVTDVPLPALSESIGTPEPATRAQAREPAQGELATLRMQPLELATSQQRLP